MAERYVKGYEVDADKLYSAIGSKLFSFEDVKNGQEKLFLEIEGLLKENGIDIKDALKDLEQGTLHTENASGYARILELIVKKIGRAFPEEIDVVSTYYFETRSFGRWNEVLKWLELKHLASLWSKANFHFPWKEAKNKGHQWPCWTLLLSEDINVLLEELKGFDQKKIDTIPKKFLYEDTGDAQKEELKAGLNTLISWLSQAQKSGVGSILLQMDGDQ